MSVTPDQKRRIIEFNRADHRRCEKAAVKSGDWEGAYLHHTTADAIEVLERRLMTRDHNPGKRPTA